MALAQAWHSFSPCPCPNGNALVRASKRLSPLLLAGCLFVRGRFGFDVAHLEEPMVAAFFGSKHERLKAAIQREAMKHTEALRSLWDLAEAW